MSQVDPTSPKGQRTSQEENFVNLDIGDPNAWDDTALIRAFQVAVDAHNPSKNRATTPANKSLKAPISSNPQPVGSIRPQPPTAAPEQIAAPPPPSQSTEAMLPTGRSNETHIPPPPPALLGNQVPQDMERLLMAWYEAGYLAGLYAASHKSQK